MLQVAGYKLQGADCNFFSHKNSSTFIVTSGCQVDLPIAYCLLQVAG